jgi:hypothetical protein
MKMGVSMQYVELPRTFRIRRFDGSVMAAARTGPSSYKSAWLPCAKLRRAMLTQEALAALREDTRQWWEDALARDPDELEEDAKPYAADTAGLQRFLEGEILPWFATRRKELVNRPLIRDQHPRW